MHSVASRLYNAGDSAGVLAGPIIQYRVDRHHYLHPASPLLQVCRQFSTPSGGRFILIIMPVCWQGEVCSRHLCR
nr:MAG TPA: hypothetical protein [Bacteriophage sp.]